MELSGMLLISGTLLLTMVERTDAAAQGDLFFYERQTPAAYPHLTTGFQSNTAIYV